MCFWCVYELGVASKRAAGAFFRQKKAFPDFLTMSILEIPRICWISVYMDFGTCLKRRAPKNHAFWRYWDLQISHGEPIGEQNDELNLDVWTCILASWLILISLLPGPGQYRGPNKIMNFDGTQTSRSLLTTRLVTKTMDGLNPPNVNPINSN